MMWALRQILCLAILLCSAVPVSWAVEPAAKQVPAEPEIASMPALEAFVEAPYPEAATADQVEATVLLEIDIAATGAVEAVRVLESNADPSYGFEAAAMTAAKLFRFSPAILTTGEAIPVTLTYAYNFVFRAPALDEAKSQPPEPQERLRGRLLERGTRRPLSGVRVAAAQRQGSGLVETRTDVDGRFTFFDLEPGAWQLLAENPGYYPLRTTETISADERLEATFYLERASYSPFDVTVETTRSKKEVNRFVIKAQEMEKLPGAFGDPLQTIQNLPSVARVPVGGQIIVRGAAPEDTRVNIDGMEVPLLYHFGGLRSALPLGMLESIDFVPGNFSVAYGRATGGVLDVKTKTLRPPRTQGYVDVSLLDAGIFVETPLGKRGGLALAARRSYIDYVLNAAVPDDADINLIAAPRYYDFQALATFEPSPEQDLRFSFLGSDDLVKVLFEEAGDFNAQLNDSRLTSTTSFYRGAIHHTVRPNARVENRLGLSLGKNRFGFQLGDQLNFDLDFWVAQVRDTVVFKGHERLDMRAGADIAWSLASGEIRLPRPVKEGDANLTAPDLDQTLYTRFENQTEVNSGLFVELEWRPIDGLTLTPGLRGDFFQTLEATALAPRFSARYEPFRQWALKGGVGVYHQSPTPDELDATFGNPQLGPERAVHYSFGTEILPLPNIKLDVTGFYKSLTDVVSRTDTLAESEGNVTPLIYDNGGVGRVYGVDMLLRHDFSNNFFGWITYTLSRAQRRDSGAAVFRPFDFDQTHILTLVASYRLPRNWEISSRWRLVSGNPSTPVLGSAFNSDLDRYEPIVGEINSDRLPTFHQLDVRVDKRWVYETWMLNVYLDVQNAYNRANPEARVYNFDYSRSKLQQGLPILAVLGVKAEF